VCVFAELSLAQTNAHEGFRLLGRIRVLVVICILREKCIETS